MIQGFVSIKSVINAFVALMSADASFSFLLHKDAGGINLFEETEALAEKSPTPWVNITLPERPVILQQAGPMNEKQMVRAVYELDIVFCCSNVKRDSTIWGEEKTSPGGVVTTTFVGLLDFYSLMIDFLEDNNSLDDLVEDLLEWPIMECDVLPPIPAYQFYKAGIRMVIRFYKDIPNV